MGNGIWEERRTTPNPNALPKAVPVSRIPSPKFPPMIDNLHEPGIPPKVQEEAGANAVVDAVAVALAASPDPFAIELNCAGLEVVAQTPLSNGLPNRARMKVFSPKPGYTRVFFFKKSLVPYSRDRYSYGGLDLRTSTVNAQEVAAWLAFLTSGFHPVKRPEKLRRAFPYEIPE